jgi:hypothetical protein
MAITLATLKLYDSIRDDFLTGAFDWLSGSDIYVSLVKVAPFNASDAVVDDLLANGAWPQYSPTGTGTGIRPLANGFAQLTGRVSNGAGIGDAAATLAFGAVTADSPNQYAIVIHEDTSPTDGANFATDRLIAYITSGTGVPVVPDGSNVTIEWSTSPNGIFKL